MFEENRVWNGDLADVVEIAAAIESGEILAREAQRFAQHHRCHRQTLAVFARVLIAMLHGLRQCQQNGLRLLQRIDERFVAQHRPDSRPHYRRVQRLDQKLVGAGGDSNNFVLHALQIGDHQHRDQLRGAARFHVTAELWAAHLRQHQVQNHQVDLFGLQ